MDPLLLKYHWKVEIQADAQMLEEELAESLQRHRPEDVSFEQSTALAQRVHL